MAYTLANYAASTENKLAAGVINTILDDAGNGAASGGGLLKHIPIVSMNALTMEFTKVNTEGPSSGVAFRALNSNFPESTMTYYQETINMAFVGGDVSIDLAFLMADNYIPGTKPDVANIEMKSKLINRTVNNTIHNGDRSVDMNSYNGGRKWLDPNQVVQATDIASGSTNGFDIGSGFTTADGKLALSLLDRLGDFVGGYGPDVIIGMNWYARWAIFRALENSAFLKTTEDSYNRSVTEYRGSPIVNFGSKAAVETLSAANTNTNSVIPNNFTYGGTSTATEIWAYRMNEDDGCALYEQKPLDSRVVAEEAHSAPQKIIRIDWHNTFYPKRKDAIAVARGIKVV